MLRKRVITVLTFNDGVLFRTKDFTPDYRYTLNFVDTWSVDEIVVLDVTRPGQGERRNFYDVIGRFARKCHVPLTAGGGVRSLDDVRQMLALGADKVVVNTALGSNPGLISEISAKYGAQCVVASIDARLKPDGSYEVFIEQGVRSTGRDPVSWARRAVELGAGEVLLTAMDRDGALEGCDNRLCRMVASSVDVPVLILGGAGRWQHFADAFKIGGASAVCTQNIYHFTETAIRNAKTFLKGQGIAVRA